MTATGVALVSGGSRGIGRATALRLAQDGYAIAFCYRSDETAAEGLTKELADLGVPVRAQRVDVSDAAAVRSWTERVEADLGPVALAVCSAGITRDGPLALMPDGDWQSVVHTNLDGVFNVCRSVVYPMLKRRRGAVVTISSVSGVYGNAGQTNYSAAKAGIIGFTKALAKEVGRYGVRANAVAPGFVDTDMTEVLAPAARAAMVKSIPLGRFGRAEEVAEAVAFLGSDRAAYITGSVCEISGGLAI